MRHRPTAGGTIDHSVVGLLSMGFAVLVGIGGAGLSLLLRLPGLEHATPFIRAAAQAHVPLLVFFAFIPASLGGLAVALLPGQVGSSRSAFPSLDTAALVLTIAALVALVAGACGLGSTGIIIAANTLALASTLGGASMLATGLIERTVPFSRLPCSAWTILIAAALAVCAAPIMAAAFSVALWHGVASGAALSVLIWPALLAILVLVAGLVTDILAEGSGDPPGSFIPAVLGGGILFLFMWWAYCLENRIAFEAPSGVSAALLLLLIAPIGMVWIAKLARARGLILVGRLPVLFATGFIVMLPVGLIGSVVGNVGHEPISLAIVFGLLAGFFRMIENDVRRPVALWLAQAQFWLLLGGSLSLLLPLSPMLKALGSAMSCLSVGLFVVHLVAALVRSRSATREVDQAALAWRWSS